MGDVHDLSYYAKCMIGGNLACGLTHTAIVTLDLIKCQRQVYPDKYSSLMDGVRKIYSKNGLRGITLGWGPTFVGYSL